MRTVDYKTGDIYYVYSGEYIPRMEDVLSVEELKQIENDMKLDGGPGAIPDWSKYYKGKKNS